MKEFLCVVFGDGVQYLSENMSEVVTPFFG